MMDLIPGQCAGQSVGALNHLLSTMIHTLLASHCSISAPEAWPEDYGAIALKKGLEEYDFVVVGSGSAGSVVANRLSENPDWKVLVLEAGGNPPMEAEIPFMFLTLQHSSIDWNFTAEASKKFGTGLVNGVSYNRGKCIGGSGEMNAMFYIRGNKRDYDDWEAAGNPTWGWSNVLEYFKKSERMLAKDIVNSPQMSYHGTNGPWTIGSFEKHDDPLKKIIVAALNESGIQKVVDFNGDEFVGVGDSQGNLWKGVRQSPGRSFLASAKDRPNLHIIKGAHVTQLNIDDNGHVSGVEFDLKGNKMYAIARKEYILSAGAINTPQILMLSGIGPEDQLESFGIKSRINLAVGENLQDHPFVPLFFTLPTNVTATHLDEFYAYFQYLLEKKGDFTTSAASDLMFFMNTKDSSGKYPDIQIHHMLFKRGEPYGLKTFTTHLGFNKGFIKSILETLETSSVFAMLVVLLNPKSRGNVQLRSANPHHKVQILPNFLDHQDDLDTLRNAIQFQLNLVNSKSFVNHKIENILPEIKECRNFIPDSDDFWNCYIRHATVSLYHPSGTAKMGPDTDPQAVVDHRLKVYSTDNLRVVDGSVMPKIPSGNTQAPIIMVAEKAADFIRDDWN